MKRNFIILLVLSLIGFALSLLSLHQFVSLRLGGDLSSSFCSISEHVNCAQVHLSPWSSLFKIPLASYGLAFYLLTALLATLGLSHQVLRREECRDFITISAILASLSSVALFLISELSIGALCPVCLAMYLTNFALLYFSWSIPSGEGLFGRAKNAFRAGIRLLGIWIPAQRPIAGILMRLVTLLVLCVALALIISGEGLMRTFYISMHPKESDKAANDQKAQAIQRYVTEWENEKVTTLPIVRNQAISGDFTKGRAGAPIQIVEFSDYECPHCQQLGIALSAMIKEYPDAFEVVHKDFPLDSTCNRFSGPVHPGSCRAAEYARCAGEQGKFWAVAESFFSSGIPRARNETILESRLLNDAGSFGLEVEPLRECLASHRHLDKIRKDAELGDSLGLLGTPAVWINGKYLRTPHPDIVRTIIEQLIKTPAK